MDRAPSKKNWAEIYYDNNFAEEGPSRRPSSQSQQQVPERMSSTTHQRQPTHALYPPPTGIDATSHDRPNRRCGEVKYREFVPSSSVPRPTAKYNDEFYKDMGLFRDSSARSNEYRQRQAALAYHTIVQPPPKHDNSASKPIDRQAPTPPMPGLFDGSPRPPWWETTLKDEVPKSHQAVKLPMPALKEPVKEMPPPAPDMVAPDYYVHPPVIYPTLTIKSDGRVGCLDCKRTFSSRARYDDHHMPRGCMPDLNSAKDKALEEAYQSWKISPVQKERKKQASAETHDTFNRRRDADRKAKIGMGGLFTPPHPTDSHPVHKPKPVKTFAAEETERLECVWEPVDKEAARKAVEEGAKPWVKPSKRLSDAVSASLAKAAEEKKELHKQIQRVMGEAQENTDRNCTCEDDSKPSTKAQELKQTTEPLQKKLDELYQTKKNDLPQESDQAHASKVSEGNLKNAVDNHAPPPLKHESQPPNPPTKAQEPNTQPPEQNYSFASIQNTLLSQGFVTTARDIPTLHTILKRGVGVNTPPSTLRKMMTQEMEKQLKSEVLARQKLFSEHSGKKKVTEKKDRAQETIAQRGQTTVTEKKTSTKEEAPSLPTPSHPSTVKAEATPPYAKKPREVPRTIYPSYVAPATKKSSWVSVSMPKGEDAVSGLKVEKKVPRKGETVALTEQEERDLAAGFENLSLESEGEEGWEEVEGELNEWEVL